MCRKQNFESSLDFYFSLSLLPSLNPPLFVSLFLPHFFFSPGHLVGFILVGKVFRKAFRILGLDERKGRWVVEQDFDGNFYFTCFFAFLCGVLDRCMLILVWFEDLFTLYKLADKVVLDH